MELYTRKYPRDLDKMMLKHTERTQMCNTPNLSIQFIFNLHAHTLMLVFIKIDLMLKETSM